MSWFKCVLAVATGPNVLGARVKDLAAACGAFADRAAHCGNHSPCFPGSFHHSGLLDVRLKKQPNLFIMSFAWVPPKRYPINFLFLLNCGTVRCKDAIIKFNVIMSGQAVL